MRAVIIGAGVAGPVLGMFLQRAGIASMVCEARPELDREGAFLGLAPNGMNVLHALGLAEQVAGRGVPAEGFRFYNAAGEPIGSIDNREAERRYGARLTMIKRADLHEVLLAAAQARGVPVRFSSRLTSIASNERGVTALLENGERESGDILVGCDGLRSRTRALVFPEAADPPYTGQLDFGGFTRSCADDPLEPGWNYMLFGRRAFFGALRTYDDEIWWFHNSGGDAPVHALAPEARRERIVTQHAEDPRWVGALVRRTERVLGPWPLHEVMNLRAFHRGRVCLIGDAAHATSPSGGQGASLALEDALALARCLRDHPTPEQAFAAFDALRRPRIAAVVAQSRRNSGPKIPRGALGRFLRDRALPLFLKLGARAQHEGFAYRLRWE